MKKSNRQRSADGLLKGFALFKKLGYTGFQATAPHC